MRSRVQFDVFARNRMSQFRRHPGRTLPAPNKDRLLSLVRRTGLLGLFLPLSYSENCIQMMVTLDHIVLLLMVAIDYLFRDHAPVFAGAINKVIYLLCQTFTSVFEEVSVTAYFPQALVERYMLAS